MSYQDLLTTKNLHDIGKLALIAKTILDGHQGGLHQSKRVGQGMEFSQYRSYEPGDDLRLLDWKMLARSSRYYVKQADVDTNIGIKFIIDASASMKHADDGLSKIDYCKVLCATLGHLAKEQHDSISLYSLNDEQLQTLHASNKTAHYHRFLHTLTALKATGKWPADRLSTSGLNDKKRKELIIFLSDMYAEKDELSRFAKQLKTNRNEVILIQIMSKNELEFGYKQNTTFLDLETSEKVKIDKETSRQQYVRNIRQFIADTKKDMLHAGVDYALFETNAPVGEVLSTYLKRRRVLVD